ncbi:hypothetical protein GW17_00024588 [Ensete ventricosum]|nr:hypothetical protein GW17_00024588 [Ensete ventricosum]
MKFPLPMISSSANSVVAIRSFLHRYCSRPRLPPSQLLSFEASSAAAAVRSFLRHYCHSKLPSPLQLLSVASSIVAVVTVVRKFLHHHRSLFPHFLAWVTLFFPPTIIDSRLLTTVII